MKRTRIIAAGCAAAVCALQAGMAPALAGGVNYERVVKHRVPAAVPVPAPVPVPDAYTGIYLRADAAYSMNDTKKYDALSPFDTDAFRADEGLQQFGRYGIGAGYHFSRWLRGDVTLDLRSEVKSKGGGSVSTALGAGVMRDTYFDQFRSKNWTGLANLYLDMPAWSALTPYVGAGVGFVVHTSDGRTFTHSRSCDAAALLAGCVASSTTANGARQSDVALAAAFMAGINYKLSDYASLDFGYRLLHLQGTTFSTPGDGGSAAKVALPDQNIHELRVGYRWDLN